MRLERTAAGFRLGEDEEVYLDLTPAQYEDIFYALPQEPANLYMLLNGTILTEADDCAILHFLIEANGGVEPAMARLQEMVQALPPKEGDVPAVAGPATPAAPPAPAPAAPKPPEPVPVSKLPTEEQIPFEITAPSIHAAPPAPTGEVTKRYEKRPPPPVVVQVAETGKRVKISCGSTALDMGVARYEDLFYALPGQNASIFRLINDTILTRPEERDILKDMVNLLGGVDGGMTAIQNAVLKVEPPKKVVSKPPAVRPATVGPPSQARPGGPPSQVKPGIPGKPPVPSGPRPLTVTDDVEVVDDVEVIPTAPVETGARPGVPGASARAPVGPGPKKSEPPSVRPPVKPGQPASVSPARPLQPGVAPPARPGQPAALSPGKPGAPPSKPGTPAPQAPATLSPAQRRKKEIDRPAGKVEIKMTKEDVEKTGVKVKSIPNVGYQIIRKEYYIQLSKAQYQELHYALPMPVMNMFKLIHNDLLKDPQSRGVLMKMIHLAGGPKDFMSALTLQVQLVKPTEDWQ
ncbi:MAG: hypothetical protein HYY18_02875 [Planctomycetes bacterium]|nr:hypothetical protein [Planctomycetota bacterium]